MASRTAQYMCDRVRFHTGLYDRSILRDGFDEDEGQADRDILSALNDALRLAHMTGQFVCEFRIEVTEDQSIYPKQEDMGLIKSICYQEVPLTHNSIQAMEGFSRRTWRSQATGTPTEYFLDIPDYIGLFPTPDTTDDTGSPSLLVLAEVVAEDLVDPTDTPSRMPSGFHEGLVYCASILVCNSFGGMQDKIQNLQPYMDKYMLALQSNAQHGEFAETGQIIPHNYRKDSGVRGRR